MESRYVSVVFLETQYGPSVIMGFPFKSISPKPYKHNKRPPTKVDGLSADSSDGIMGNRP